MSIYLHEITQAVLASQFFIMPRNTDSFLLRKNVSRFFGLIYHISKLWSELLRFLRFRYWYQWSGILFPWLHSK